MTFCKGAPKGILMRVLSTASIAAMGTGAVSAPAFAQEAEEEARSDEIIVIGTTKQLQNTLDVPTTVTAYSGEALEAKSATQVSDIATFTPGFSVVQAPGNATAITLSIRGQVQTDILATLEPSVGTYVDDLYWGRAYGLNAGLLDLQSAQVLKGPQGTLFGRNTTGGALIMTSNDPDTDEFSGKASMTYGRFNEMTGEAVVNAPLSSRIAVRGAFRLSGRDGWAYGVRLVDAAGNINNTAAATNVVVPNGRKYNNKEEMQGRLKALFKISDSTDLVLAGEWYEYSAEGPARQMLYKVQLKTPGGAGDQVIVNSGVNKYLGFFPGNPNAVGVDAFNCSYATNQALNCTDLLTRSRSPYTDADTQTYSARLTSDWDIGTFKLIAGMRNVYTDNFIDLDGSSSIIHATSLTQDLDQWSVEAQFAGAAMDDRFKYVFGATYFVEDGSDLSYSYTGAANNAPGRATRNFAFIDNKSIGVYGQASFKITDQITLTGGVRSSRDKKGIDIRSANVNLNGQLTNFLGQVAPTGYVAGGQLTDPCNATAGVGGVGRNTISGATPSNDCSATKSATFKSISWMAGIDFKPSDDTLLYAKISKGYRSGGHNLRAFNNKQFTPFNPETVIEEEVGFKGAFADGFATLSLAGYHNEISGGQRTTIVTTGLVSNTLVGNAAKVRNYGVEAELLLRPTDGLTFSASGSINKPKYLSYVDDIGDRTNERFASVPEKKFALGAEYETDLSDRIGATLNLDYSWIGSMSTDACTLTGASICWPGLTADVNGRTPAQIAADIFAATQLPSAGIFNGRLTFSYDEMLYLSFWGRNIGNDRGVVHALKLNAPNRNYVSGLRREPATYGVTASVKF